jgi:phage/plasmid-associated DNA primase
MVGQMLMRIFKNHAVHVTDSRHLTGNFNAHLLDALFVFADEAFWAGDKQGEGTLKRLITEATITIEPKGLDSFQMPNRLKILMASNASWVAPVTADERRFLVLDVTDKRKGDRAYFTALAAAINGDELAAFLDYLLGLPLAEFDHRNPPHTAALNRQKLIGASSLEKFWLDCLESGSFTGDGDWPATIARTELHDAYLEHARAHGDRYPLTEEQMSTQLRKLCPDEKLVSCRPRAGDGSRHRHYQLQSLTDHREAFLAGMKIPADDYEWSDGEVDL